MRWDGTGCILYPAPLICYYCSGTFADPEQFTRHQAHCHAWREGQPPLFTCFSDELFQDLHDLPCHFLARVQYNAAYEVQEERPIAAAAQAAGVQRDGLIRRLGTSHHAPLLPQPFRVVLVASGKTRAEGTPDVLVLVTNHLDLEAELVALAYRWRWAVELFFRWLKCVLGCRHLLSQRENGVRMQVYVAIIASLLIALWVGRPPTKRTYEMLCFYVSGWATEAEVRTHIDRLHFRSPPTGKT